MLILASASPRRKELLTQVGYAFEVVASSIPEQRDPGEDAVSFVCRLAKEKAEKVWQNRAREQPSPNSPSLVLGADTVVVANEEVLGKPADFADAVRMLRLLAGTRHEVITGVCLLSGDAVEVEWEITKVTMRELADREIEAYVASGEPMDKAGAYAIQGYAGRWIPRIEGCYFNVVGLPLARVSRMIDRRM